jgi:SAM-dependent methyltransferase
VNAAPSAGVQAASFDQYAAWYNAFNQGKDYAAEAKYLLDEVRPWQPSPGNWLDVGCGTGEHLAQLKTVVPRVEGVDASAGMIVRARAAHPGIAFHHGKAEDFQCARERDVISMLFHVMSYHCEDAAIMGALENVAHHLSSDGVFVFDFWHTGGVLNDPPARRVREARVSGRSLFRIAQPTENRELLRIDIRYEFRWDDPLGPLVHVEHHALRHFSCEELTVFLANAGLRAVSCKAWMAPRAPSAEDWYAVMCATRHANP